MEVIQSFALYMVHVILCTTAFTVVELESAFAILRSLVKTRRQNCGSVVYLQQIARNHYSELCFILLGKDFVSMVGKSSETWGLVILFVRMTPIALLM